jgi:hypothetical protein
MIGLGLLNGSKRMIGSAVPGGGMRAGDRPAGRGIEQVNRPGIDPEALLRADSGEELTTHAGGQLWRARPRQAADQDHFGPECLDRDHLQTARIEADGGGGDLVVTCDAALRMPLSAAEDSALGAYRDRAVILGIRPEDLRDERAVPAMQPIDASRFMGGLARKPATKVSAGSR